MVTYFVCFWAILFLVTQAVEYCGNIFCLILGYCILFYALSGQWNTVVTYFVCFWAILWLVRAMEHCSNIFSRHLDRHYTQEKWQLYCILPEGNALWQHTRCAVVQLYALSRHGSTVVTYFLGICTYTSHRRNGKMLNSNYCSNTIEQYSTLLVYCIPSEGNRALW